MKVINLPEWVTEVSYSTEAFIIKAELDGIALEVKDGNTVVLPWNDEYQPNADFSPNPISAHTFYEPADKWVKTAEKWVYVSKDITYEKVSGGNLGKWWEIRYIIFPPFPEVPSYKMTEWAGWEIHGEIWDKKEVSYYFRARWIVRLPLFFREVGTARELEFLTENKVWFSDQEGSSEYGSDTHLDYFFERISYLAEKLEVADPSIRLKAEQEAAKAEEKAKQRAEQELVDVPYVFQELNYYCNKKIEFQIKDGKVYRLYEGKPVMLNIAPFSMEILVSKTRLVARRPPEVHRVDLGSGYAAIYKPAA